MKKGRFSEDMLRKLERMHEEYSPVLLWFCSHRMRLPHPVKENAQDVVQDVFADLAEETLVRGEPLPEQPMPYLLRMLRNKVMDRWRKHYRLLHAVEGNSRAEYPLHRPCSFATLVEQCALDEAMASLPQQACHLLMLRYEQHFTFDEISHKTGVPSATLRKRCRRALNQLRCLLTETTIPINK